MARYQTTYIIQSGNETVHTHTLWASSLHCSSSVLSGNTSLKEDLGQQDRDGVR